MCRYNKLFSQTVFLHFPNSNTMIAYIQVSQSKQSSHPTFHKLYRRCFQINVTSSNPHLPIKYEPGYIIGAVLFTGYLNGKEFMEIMDEANQQYYDFYEKSLKKKAQTIHCYPITAVIPFSTPIKGLPKGNVSALKMNPKLLNLCKAKIGKSRLKALRFLCDQYDVTKSESIKHRILVLRKEHAENTILGMKAAEFRKNPLGEKLAAKIKSKKDVAKLLKYRKRPIGNAVCKLKKFVSNLKK